MAPSLQPGSRYRAVRVAGLAAIAALLGCSDPRFRQEVDASCTDSCTHADSRADAGASDAAGPAAPPEAGPDGSAAGLPTWQTRLMGRYATRAHTFATDGIVEVRSDELALVDIVRAGEELELHYRTCESTSFSLRISGSTRIREAQALPLRTLPIRFDGKRWSTLPTTTPIGYAAEPLVSCSPGQSVAGAPEQVWLDDSCVCPSSSGPPTRADDCRVHDPDGDDLPGMSFELDTTFDALFWGVLEKRDGFINGTLDEGGARFANVLSEGTTRLFGCDSPPCSLSQVVGCKSVGNSAFFVRLDELTPPAGEWTCEALLTERSALFPVAPPTFPTDC